MAHDLIVTVIGVCPVGWEWLEYLFAGCVFIMVLKSFIMMFSIPFKMMKL